MSALRDHLFKEPLTTKNWIGNLWLEYVFQNGGFLTKNGKISEKNQKFKNLLPTIFRPYGSAYLVQISCF